jgi:branched-chain amino acid transport system ATP-binding protein
MRTDDPIIKTSNLRAGYGGPDIIRGVHLSIGRGALTTLIGPNGAGKSTLLRALYGTAKATLGEILYEGERIDIATPLTRFARGIAFVPQGRCNFAQMSVAENLKIAAHSIPRTEREQALSYVFDLFPVLAQRRAILAGNLSGGEQQMLEMAMVLQTRPKCLLVDEPSLGLSPAMQKDIFAKLAALSRSGMTVVAVEQNVREALAVSNMAVVLVQGEIVMHGSADSVLNDDGIRRAYLGGLRPRMH